MLGIIFLYYIGKYYYELAEMHDKNKWLYAILGVASYYFSTFIAAIIAVIVRPAFLEGSNTSDIVLDLLCLPFGLLGCYAFYKLLEKNWDAQNFGKKKSSNDLLDDHLGARNK